MLGAYINMQDSYMSLKQYDMVEKYLILERSLLEYMPDEERIRFDYDVMESRVNWVLGRKDLVYEKLDSHEIEDHPDIDGILAGLKAGDLKKVAGSMGNVLERVTVDAYPVIDRIKKMMIKEGALNAMMSGSGPTVFGIFEEKATARKAADAIRDARLTKQVYVTNIHNARRKR